MTVTSKPLVVAAYASNAEATVYTSTGMRAIIDKFTGYNSNAAAVTLTIKIVPNGVAAGATNIMVVKSLATGETYTFPEVVGHTLESGGFISTLASAATSVVIRVSGREVT